MAYPERANNGFGVTVQYYSWSAYGYPTEIYPYVTGIYAREGTTAATRIVVEKRED